MITTAAIPGRRSPALLTAEAVAGMKPGSVIVDMGAANGGNVVGSLPDEVVVTDNGVVIIGYSELPHAHLVKPLSSMAKIFLTSLQACNLDKDGVLHLDLDDEIVRS